MNSVWTQIRIQYLTLWKRICSNNKIAKIKRKKKMMIIIIMIILWLGEKAKINFIKNLKKVACLKLKRNKKLHKKYLPRKTTN